MPRRTFTRSEKLLYLAGLWLGAFLLIFGAKWKLQFEHQTLVLSSENARVQPTAGVADVRSEPVGMTSQAWPMTRWQPTPTPETPVTPPPLSLASLFTPPLVPAGSELQTLLVTGDVLTARHVNELVLRKQDFLWPLGQLQPVLERADLSWINLETPLIQDCPRRSDGMIFCGDLRHAAALKSLGIDVVNIANNHIGNHGAAGVTQSVEALAAQGLAVTGVTQPVIIERHGWRWAFLGFNEVDRQPGVLAADPEIVQTQIEAARSLADIVVVQFHWGAEYTRQPTARQRELAHLAVDSGADLVVGNHPHWFQPAELYRETLILYSHGNTVFDQMWSDETREGVIGIYSFVDKKLVGVEWVPTWIVEYGQATLASPEKAAKIRAELQRVSYDLADDGVVTQ